MCFDANNLESLLIDRWTFFLSTNMHDVIYGIHMTLLNNSLFDFFACRRIFAMIKFAENLGNLRGGFDQSATRGAFYKSSVCAIVELKGQFEGEANHFSQKQQQLTFSSKTSR